MVDYLTTLFDSCFTEIASDHKYQQDLLLCENTIYSERKRPWVSFL